MRISEKQDQMNYLKTSPYALLTALNEMNAAKRNTTLTKCVCVCTYIDTGRRYTYMSVYTCTALTKNSSVLLHCFEWNMN